MKKILVVCPGRYDYCELSTEYFSSRYAITFYPLDDFEPIVYQGIGIIAYDFKPHDLINALVHKVCTEQFDGIVSSDDYPGTALAVLVADKIGQSSPALNVFFQCQHKYYARLLQQRYTADITPQFNCISQLSNSDIQFPCFIKPVKSSFSIGAQKVLSMQELESVITRTLLPRKFIQQFNWFINTYTSRKVLPSFFIAEQFLEGIQVTLEGFVHNGTVYHIGIVDSVMYPGTICFKRFEYPSRLPEYVQDRMRWYTQKFITSIGLDNTLFNIEFMYNTKTNAIYIIEINPRMCPQFADLYEKVNGVNTYDILIALALGEQPPCIFSRGNYAVACSFILRVFTNQYVKKVPTLTMLDAVYKKFPNARVYFTAREGHYLSDEIQDGRSFRYALIHLGAQNWAQLYENFEECKRLLVFEFEPVCLIKNLK